MYTSLESSLRKKWGYELAGMDEAGRGPWAGPVFAACVMLPRGLRLAKLNDSKKLTKEQREQLYDILIHRAHVGWSFASVTIIDKVGIKKANHIAMIQALAMLTRKITPKFLLVDGKDKYKFDIPSQDVIRGDGKIRAIAAASIIAKVERDRFMIKMAEKYPQYDFHLHKGYGTQRHQRLLRQNGACEIHRKSFKPIMALI